MKVLVMIMAFIFLFSCGNKGKSTNEIVDSLVVPERKFETPDSFTNKTSIPVDSIELQKFWEQAVIPILEKDRQIVLNNMDFPVLGSWTAMMEMDIEPEDATRKDFEKIYNRFFSDEFRSILTKRGRQSTGTSIMDGKICYFFTVGDSLGESAVQLVYFKYGSSYKLKGVQGAGGNFYGWTKPTQ